MSLPLFGRLLRKTIRNIDKYIDTLAKPYGIGNGQFEYFLMIAGTEGISPNALAEQMNVGKASVTKAIKQLEKVGFVERTANKKDGRAVNLSTTDLGKSIIVELEDFRVKMIGTLFADFTEEEKADLVKLLTKLYKNSEKMGEL